MMKINKEKTTAHQLWCNALSSQLQAIIFPPEDASKKPLFTISRTTMRKRADDAMSHARRHQDTRLRVVVDEIISCLEATTKRSDEIKREHRETHRLRFAKRRRLQRQYLDQQLLQKGFQEALLIITNTPPPDAPMVPVKGEPEL